MHEIEHFAELGDHSSPTALAAYVGATLQTFSLDEIRAYIDKYKDGWELGHGANGAFARVLARVCEAVDTLQHPRNAETTSPTNTKQEATNEQRST